MPVDSGEQRSAERKQTDLSDQFRTRIAMTAAVQLVEEQTNGLQTDIFESNALRFEIQQLQGKDVTTMRRRVSRAFTGCRTKPLTLGFGNARMEGAAGPPRGAGDAFAHLGAGARRKEQRSSAQCCPGSAPQR